MRVPNDGWLLRDFIREALYNRTDGYFTQPSRNPVGVMSKPIPFHALLGQEDYARVLAGRYTTAGIAVAHTGGNLPTALRQRDRAVHPRRVARVWAIRLRFRPRSNDI